MAEWRIKILLGKIKPITDSFKKSDRVILVITLSVVLWLYF